MQGRSAPQRAWTAESRRQEQREKIARQVIRVANEPGEASNEKELSHRSGSEVAQQLRIH